MRHPYPARDVLLDMWVVTRYTGEPRGLDGQAVRWCTRHELAVVELLPADGPIVRVLWLPERLTQASSADYRISEFPSMPPSTAGADALLRGVFCRCPEDGLAAAAGGADFLVMRSEIPAGALGALCATVAVPVYARGMPREEAWEIGASGVHDIGD